MEAQIVQEMIRSFLTVVAAFIALVGLFAPNSIKNPTESTTTTQTAVIQTFNEEYNKAFIAEASSILEANARIVGTDSLNASALEVATSWASGDTPLAPSGMQMIIWNTDGIDNANTWEARKLAEEFWSARGSSVPSPTTSWGISTALGTDRKTVFVVYLYQE